MIRWRAVLVTMALAGCNQVFGLEDGVPLPPDTDGDGVFADDNCEDVANPEQEDRDGDTFGDACDTCPHLETPDNHDEDDDRRGDACDRCPQIPDFDADIDGDGVANECEIDSGRSTMLMFDPFIELRADWTSNERWRHLGDAIAPEHPLPSDTSGLELIAPSVSGTAWHVEVGVVSTRPWQDGDRFGVAVRSSSGTVTACEVICTSMCVWRLTNNGVTATTTTNLLPVPVTRLRMLHRPQPSAPHVLLCTADGLGSIVSSGGTAVVGTVALFSSPTIELTYLAAFANEP